MRHATLLVAILAFTPLASATAQVRPGERVRVTHLWEKSVGTFLAWKADSLVMESNRDTLAVPVDFVTRLDVRWGRKTNTGKGAGIGLLLGGVVGAVIGYASYEECVPQGWFSCIGPDFGPEVGGLGGLVVGAIIGGSPEVRVVWLRVSLGLQRNGWFGLGASVRF